MEDESREQQKPDRLSDITGIISEFNSPKPVKEAPGLKAASSKPEKAQGEPAGEPPAPVNEEQKSPREQIKPENAGHLPDNVGPGPEDVGLGPKDVDPGPKDVGLGPEDVGLGPEDVGLGPKDVGLGPEDVDPGPEDVGLGPKDVDPGPEDVGPGPKDAGLQSKKENIKTTEEKAQLKKALPESKNSVSLRRTLKRQQKNHDVQLTEENSEQKNTPDAEKTSLLQSLLNPPEQEEVEVIPFNRNISFVCDKSGSIVKLSFSYYSNHYNRKEKRLASVMLKQIKISCRILNGYSTLSQKEYLLIHREITNLLSGQGCRVASVCDFTNVLIYACKARNFSYEDLGKAFLYRRRRLERIMRVLKLNNLVKLNKARIDKCFFISNQGLEFVKKALENVRG